MNIQLTGKRALVCRSSQGIGKAIAIELSRLGASVTLLARDPERLHEVKAALGAGQNQHHHVLVADFNRPDEVKAALTGYVSETDPVHILVNNSGGPPPGTVLPDAKWNAMAARLRVNPGDGANSVDLAWVKHIVHHLAPTGHAGLVLSNGSNQSGMGEIRKPIVIADFATRTAIWDQLA